MENFGFCIAFAHSEWKFSQNLSNGENWMLLAIDVCQLQYQLQNRQGENENLSGIGARRWYLFKKLLI